MRRALTVCATILFATVCVSVVHAVSFTATLSGVNEVPANASTNVGATVVNVDPASSTISWTTTTTIPLASATGHHIHQQVAGVNGPVVVSFEVAYSGSVVNTTVAPQILDTVVTRLESKARRIEYARWQGRKRLSWRSG